jgi:hypothetical protein
VIDEPFMENLNWLSDLKLRGSFGITGNAGGISPYQSLSTVASTGSNYQINHVYTTGINPTGIANPTCDGKSRDRRMLAWMSVCLTTA